MRLKLSCICCPLSIVRRNEGQVKGYQRPQFDHGLPAPFLTLLSNSLIPVNAATTLCPLSGTPFTDVHPGRHSICPDTFTLVSSMIPVQKLRVLFLGLSCKL